MGSPPYPNTPLGPGTSYPWDPQNGQGVLPWNQPGSTNLVQPQTPPAVQVPAAGNIDPNANINPNVPSGQLTPGQQGPAQPNVPGTTVPQQGAVPGLGAVGGPGGSAQVDQITAQSRQEISDAQAQVSQAFNTINTLQSSYSSETDPLKQQQISAQLVSAYNQLGSAEQRVATANAAYSSTLTKALDTTTLSPEQANLYKSQAGAADAQAQNSTAQAKVLLEGAPGQQAYVAAQAGAQNATAAYQRAQADATQAKTPAEVNQLQAQASYYQAQGNQINVLLPSLKAKADAETGLTQAQTDLTGSQSDYYKAQSGFATANANLAQSQADYQKAQLAAGGPQAAVGLQQGQTAAQYANAAGTLAGVQQNLQGPLYGLQDRINAIRSIQQQMFQPGSGKSIDQMQSDANDLLNQFTNASIAGTTPYAASVAGANAGLTAFGTQASMFNAAQQALASRANALTGLGGSVLGTLGTMNANAPAGSTAMAGAFKDIVDYMANKAAAAGQSTPGGVQAVAQPQAPALPPLLQRLAGLPAQGQSAPSGPVSVGPGLSMPNPAAAAPTFTPPSTQSPQTSAPVTINIGGQNQPSTPAPTPPPGGFAPPSQQPGTYGQLSGSMPNLLSQYAPSQDPLGTVHQLWGNELQSGAVSSPYQQSPGMPA